MYADHVGRVWTFNAAKRDALIAPVAGVDMCRPPPGTDIALETSKPTICGNRESPTGSVLVFDALRARIYLVCRSGDADRAEGNQTNSEKNPGFLTSLSSEFSLLAPQVCAKVIDRLSQASPTLLQPG